ncbi:MAG: sulfite exporter TauE/SafE family protein [Candidatus Omnitrophica bacterium]|nr:sulfite exporter TauE/SafE family protein [Candidatus Omnitrophota bacterium]
MDSSFPWAVLPGIFFVAFLYSAVGHGGASGYLAVLSWMSLPPAAMAASALVLNCLVSGIALFHFTRAGHLSLRLTWPFAAASVPAAWMGGWLRISPGAYEWLLAGVLAAAAWRLWIKLPESTAQAAPSLAVALPSGAGVGFLSGMVGIGGGIFLSPLLLFKKWASPKQASATSAFFILVNSVAGLMGRSAQGLSLAGPWLGLTVVACAGGLLGSRLGARRFSGAALRRLLAVVLAVAAIKAVFA